MRRLIGANLLLAGLVILPSAEVHAQKKKAPKDVVPVIDSSKLAAGEFVGILKSTPATDRTFTIETETQKLVLKGKGKGGKGNANLNRLVQAQSQMDQAQLQLARARTPQQRQQAMRHLQQAQVRLQQAIAQVNRSGGLAGTGYQTQTVKQAIDFQASETVKVRTMILPEQFDDKGNPKKYTKEELAQLKGKDRSLPGYESSLEKLEVGQRVRVTLASAPVKPGAKDKDKDKDREEDLVDKKMQVKLIVIVEESKGIVPPPKGKKKAK
jgi:hypothetical protein